MKLRYLELWFVNCLILIFHFSTNLNAQKKTIDYYSHKTWPKIVKPEISCNGDFVMHIIKFGDSCSNLVLQSSVDSWRKEICNVVNAVFLADGHKVLYETSKDSIGIVELGTSEKDVVLEGRNIIISKGGDGNWFAFQKRKTPKDFFFRNILTGSEFKYSNVINFKFSNNEIGVCLQVQMFFDKSLKKCMIYRDLISGEEVNIWNGFDIGSYAFDESDTTIAFVGVQDSVKFENKLLYFKKGMIRPIVLLDESNRGMERKTVSTTRDIGFSADCKTIFFYLETSDDNLKVRARDTTGNLIIWNSFDDILRTDVPNFIDRRSYATCMNLEHPNQIIPLEIGKDDYIDQYSLDSYPKRYLIVRSNSNGNHGEYKWRSSAKPDIWLVSIDDGIRNLLLKKTIDTYVNLSPNGKFAIWFDRRERQWFVYDIRKKVKRNISQEIKYPLNADIDYHYLSGPADREYWFENDSAVLLSDRYDLWMVDPNGKWPPKNITNGKGRSRGIRFGVVNLSQVGTSLHPRNGQVIITAFNTNSKENGIIKLPISTKINVDSFKMLKKAVYYDYVYTPGLSPDADYRPFLPLKAQNAERYLVKMTDAHSFPNLCVTEDFASFMPLTEYNPQEKYNWYTNELLHWRSGIGENYCGILYKPTNFDINKRYPLIILLYEKFSDILNAYLNPHLSNGVLNIPWFVSNGYLVFVPDINYKIGYPGKSCLNAVLSSAEYLSKCRFVDKYKLGLQGISYGGFEINYIVSHTNIFAAAAPAAGVCNLMSEAGQISNNSGKHEYYEERQGRIGSSLWKSPELYIENSPIFSADKVNTPLLILHNKLDDAVYPIQGIEWFTALRRLGKKAWMLQYVDENHSLLKERNKLDYSIRLGEFFGFYLKCEPKPKWMEANNSN